MRPPLSRRQFLGVSAAAAGLSLSNRIGLGTVAFGAVPGRDDYGGFAMGIQSFSLRAYSVEEAIRLASGLRLDHIEFYKRHFSPDATAEEIAAMQQNLKRAGLRALAHGVNNFTSDHMANRKLFQFAKRARIRNLSANPSHDSFDSLDKLVREFDIRIAIHNHGPGALYSTIDDVLNVVKDRDPRIGACADLGHYIRSAQDPIEAIRRLKGRLYGVHLKDVAEPRQRTHGVVLGQGHLDVAATFRALREVEFPVDGALSLEYEENKDNPLPDIEACLAVASEAARQTAS